MVLLMEVSIKLFHAATGHLQQNFILEKQKDALTMLTQQLMEVTTYTRLLLQQVSLPNTHAISFVKKMTSARHSM
jgi:hypothetical protein